MVEHSPPAKDGDAHVDVASDHRAMGPRSITDGMLGDLHGAGIVPRILHPERRKDVVVQEARTGLTAQALDQVAQEHVARVAVAPGRARREVERLVAKAGDELLRSGGIDSVRR